MADVIPKFRITSTAIKSLGPRKIDNPELSLAEERGITRFVDDSEGVMVVAATKNGVPRSKKGVTFEAAGPRDKIYFDPSKLKVAIVTCGGMCPGINSLVRAIVLQLHYIYGVQNILGIRYGLQGFIPSYGHDIIELTPEMVQSSHGRGGSFLGMSRGPQPIDQVVDALERQNISLLFMIGGDGTLNAAKKIVEEIDARGIRIAVIGIPKTIDNDILFVSRTFGFETAVEAATRAILGAHNEALGAPHGIGLVKLMGRHSGFVAAHATLALTEVNFCLIPEVDFDLEGEAGLLAALEQRLKGRGHSVIVVAEGAGQKCFAGQELGTDASGNPRLGDIGAFLKKEINRYFGEKDMEINLKYIDPSYLIRSVPANPSDRVFTGFLGRMAVHAGMAGKTDMMVSLWNNHYVHVPLELATRERCNVDIDSSLWRAVQEATGQHTLSD